MRWLKVIAAIGLLAALYWHCDWRRVAAALGELQVGYLAAAISLFVPQTIVSAWRWQRLAAPLCRISLWEAVRQTLASSAWNLAVPSKLGDLTKVAALPIDSRRQLGHASVLVVVEKACDVVALLLLWLVGAAFGTHNGWLLAASAVLPVVGMSLARSATRYSVLSTQYSVLSVLHSALRTPRSALCLLASLALWFLHLWQIHLMLLAAGVNVEFHVSLARVPAAIFAGLLPVSLCGMGTRDGALIWLFSDVAPASTMAAVGLLTATRYLVPGALGIPLIWQKRSLTQPGGPFLGGGEANDRGGEYVRMREHLA